MELFYWIFILSSIKVTLTQFYNYTDSVNNYTAVCGCYNESFTYNLQRPAGEVIRVEGNLLPMRYKTLSATENCPITSNASCAYGATLPTGLGAPPDNHRLTVYKNCTYKNTCSITNDALPGSRNVIYYFYQWETESKVVNISNSINQSGVNSTFYFTGEDHVGTTINCQCVISSVVPVTLETYYINIGPESCSKIKMTYDDQELITCSTNGNHSFHKLHPNDEVNNIHLQINITDMEPDVNDVMFFRVYGTVSVKCTGCETVTTPSTTTSTTKTTNNIVTSALNPDTTQLQDNLMLTSTDSSSQSSTDQSDSSSVQPTTSDERDTIPQTNQMSSTMHNKSDTQASSEAIDAVYDYVYILIGLLVALIVINILVITIYRVIRKRRKSRNNGNSPVQNGEASFARGDSRDSPQNENAIPLQDNVYAHYQYIDHIDLDIPEATPPQQENVDAAASANVSAESTSMVNKRSNPKNNEPAKQENKKLNPEYTEVKKDNKSVHFVTENLYSEPTEESPDQTSTHSPIVVVSLNNVKDENRYELADDDYKPNNVKVSNVNISDTDTPYTKTEKSVQLSSAPMKPERHKLTEAVQGGDKTSLAQTIVKPIITPQQATLEHLDADVEKENPEQLSPRLRIGTSESDTYHHIGSDQTRGNDCSSAIPVSKDNYNHIGPDLKLDQPPSDTYDHIGSEKPAHNKKRGNDKNNSALNTSTKDNIGSVHTLDEPASDTYYHIGSDKTRGNDKNKSSAKTSTKDNIGSVHKLDEPPSDTYDHIGSEKPAHNKKRNNDKNNSTEKTSKTDSDNHIGSVLSLSEPPSDTYDHIGSEKTAHQTKNSSETKKDNYNHISPGLTLDGVKLITNNNYSHIDDNMTIIGERTPSDANTNTVSKDDNMTIKESVTPPYTNASSVSEDDNMTIKEEITPPDANTSTVSQDDMTKVDQSNGDLFKNVVKELESQNRRGRGDLYENLF